MTSPTRFPPDRFSFLLYLLIWLSFFSCLVLAGNWDIGRDINRLLAEDDGFYYDRNEQAYSGFNSTVNITTNENITGYWHLSADAPLAEQPTVDTTNLHETKQPWSKEGFPEQPDQPCSRLQILPISPLVAFITCVCCCSLLGLLSASWMLLLCTRRQKHEDPSLHNRAFTYKCRIIVGLHIHASICVFAYLTIQLTARGVTSFITLDSCRHAKFCSIAMSVLNLCTSVFWLLVGLSNVMLIAFLRGRKPGVISPVQRSPSSRIFRSHRNVIFLSLLLHTIPWITAVALNTLQIIFLQAVSMDCASISDTRSSLIEALTCAIPVIFAVLSIIIRIQKFRAHRLHLPSQSRAVPDYACQHDHCLVARPSPGIQTIDNFVSHQSTIGLFSNPFISGLQLACSLLAILSVCLWIASVAAEETRFLPRIYNALMFGAVGLFYSCPVVGLCRRLGLGAVGSLRNRYIPGEMAWANGVRAGSPILTPMEAKLSPRELLEIPQFTRTQFFDTLSDTSQQKIVPLSDEIATSKAVQIITVYEPVVG